jgi:hypothetical protein
MPRAHSCVPRPSRHICPHHPRPPRLLYGLAASRKRLILSPHRGQLGLQASAGHEAATLARAQISKPRGKPARLAAPGAAAAGPSPLCSTTLSRVSHGVPASPHLVALLQRLQIAHLGGQGLLLGVGQVGEGGERRRPARSCRAHPPIRPRATRHDSHADGRVAPQAPPAAPKFAQAYLFLFLFPTCSLRKLRATALARLWAPVVSSASRLKGPGAHSPSDARRGTAHARCACTSTPRLSRDAVHFAKSDGPTLAAVRPQPLPGRKERKKDLRPSPGVR